MRKKGRDDRPMGTRSYRRACARIALLLGLITTAACTSLTTRVAGWYVTREIDGYFDLTSEQKKEVQQEVDLTLEELRRDQLPRWVNLLRSARDTIGRGADEAQLAALQARYDQLMDAGVGLLAPKFAKLFAALDDRQIDHFAAHAQERLDDVYEEQKLPAEKRRAKQDERLLEGLESLVGDLRADQKRTVLALVHSFPDERPAQYRVSKARIWHSRSFLRKHPGAAAIEAEMHRLWRTRYDEFGPGRDQTSRRAEQRHFMLTVDRTLSPEQRREGVENVNERIRQLARLSLPSEAQ